MIDAVLIGPERSDSTILNEYECAVVHNALRMARSADKEEDAISYALRYSTNDRGKGLRPFLDQIMERLGEHCEDMRGLLWNWDAKELIFLREEEGQEQIDTITALFKLLTAGGWLAEFLKLRLSGYAEKCPPPLEVMYWLAEQALYFESDVEHAKDLIKRYPKMLGIEPIVVPGEAEGDQNAEA